MLFLSRSLPGLGIKQAKANDRLIVDLEDDKDLAKSHHRKAEPVASGLAKVLMSGLIWCALNLGGRHCDGRFVCPGRLR